MNDSYLKIFKVKDLILNHVSGPSPTCEERNIKDDEEWGLLKTTAVVWDGWNPNAHKVPPREYWGKHQLEVQSGDVLVTKAGPRNRVGVVVYVDKTPKRLMISGKMIGLKPNHNLVDFRALAAALSSESSQRYLDVRTTGMAETQLNFTNQLLLDTEVRLPELKAQKKISSILNTVDNLIDQTQNLIDKYAAVKQGMMADLFALGIDLSGTPETNKNYGRLRPSCKDAPDLYHETELGWVPKIWEEATLREQLVNIEQGWSPDCDSEGATEGCWGVLKTTSVVWEGFDFSANKALPSELTPKKEYEIKAGDVLMTRAGPGNRVGVVVHVSSTQNKLLLSDKLYRIIPTERIGKQFLALLLSSELIQKQINATKTGLAESQSNISQDIVKKLKVFIPSIREQELIVERMSAINEKIDTEKKYLIKLKLEKKGLMQDLITGKVKV